MLGYAFCASFCTMGASFSSLRTLIDMGYEIQPIMSENAYTKDTRFHKAEDFIGEVEEYFAISLSIGNPTVAANTQKREQSLK